MPRTTLSRPLPASGLAFLLLLAAAGPLRAHRAGAPDGYTGAPPDSTTCLVCHAGQPLQDPESIGFALPPEYQPGRRYSLLLQFGRLGVGAWGFQLTVQDSLGQQAGVLIPPPADAPATWLSDNPWPQPDYLNQTADGADSPYPNGMIWSFDWIAPPVGTGPVKAHAAIVTGDGDSTTAGDLVWALERSSAEGPGADSARLYLPATEHHYGLTPLGNDRPWNVRCYNIGGQPLTVAQLAADVGEAYSTGPELPLPLQPGEDQAFTLYFSPPFAAYFQDRFAVLDGEGNVLDSLLVTGTGTTPLPPDSFSLVAPEDGAHLPADLITLRWRSTSNRDSTLVDSVSFHVEVDRESDFATATLYPAGTDTSLALPAEDLEVGRIHFWRVRALDTNTGGRLSSQTRAFFPEAAGVEPSTPAAGPPSPGLRLHPNPANAAVAVRLQLPARREAVLALHDLTGRHVATLHRGPLEAGTYRFALSTASLASGLYLLTLRGDGLPPTARKLLVLR